MQDETQVPRPKTQSPPILIRTVKSDKDDRYLADLFIPLPSGVRNRRGAFAALALSRHCDPAATAGGGKGGRSNLIQYEYLNQTMLDHGLAVRVEE